jgi:hypothetical protein
VIEEIRAHGAGADGGGRTRRPLLRALSAGALLLALAGSPAAHQLKEALTTVEVNERSGLVEVVHRFWIHDAEHAVTRLGGLSGDIRTDPALQQAFGRYVARAFVLADAEGAPLELSLLGTEVDGPFIWVYEEMDADRFADIAFVAHGSMQEVWSDQLNQVNVKRPSGTRSLYLRAGDSLVAVPPPATPTS